MLRHNNEPVQFENSFYQIIQNYNLINNNINKSSLEFLLFSK